MSNDDEKSAVFGSRQNSCSDDAARIEDCKPFQAARAAATGKARSPSVTRLVDQCRRRSRPKASTCIYVRGLADGLGKIRSNVVKCIVT